SADEHAQPLIDEHDTWTILVALHEHTALLDVAGERRFRMHDRVRDFAESKLAKDSAPSDEAIDLDRNTWKLPNKAAVLARLLNCWTGWDLVVSELGWIGAHELARQYHVLRQRRDIVGHAAGVPSAAHAGRVSHEDKDR